MDEYFNSETFQHTLIRYENMLKKNQGDFLDSEELAEIAEYYQFKGEIDKAVEAVNIALKIYPGAVGPGYVLARIVAYQDKDLEKAYKIAEQINDKSDFNYFYLISELKCLEGKEKEADNFLKEHLSELKYYKDENIEDYIWDCATIFFDSGYPEIAKDWIKLYADKESIDYKELLGKIHTALQNYDTSNNILNELLDEEPYSNEYWDQMADNQYNQGKYAEALTSSEYSIAINPNNPHAILNKANSLFGIGNSDEACKYYERFLQICNEEEKSVVYITMGHIELERNNKEQASIYFTKGIETSTNIEIAYIQVAIAAFDHRYFLVTYVILKQYLEKMPKNWEQGYGIFARCCFELGKMDEYKTALKQAVSKNEKECEEVLGNLYPDFCNPSDYIKYKPNENNRNIDFPYDLLLFS